MKKRSKDRYSTIKKLREEKKSNDLFEIMVNNLTLEELISLKLELATKSVGTTIFGLPWWDSLHHIVKESMLRYALAVTTSKNKAIQFLGIDKNLFYELLTRYGLRNYYNNPKGEEDEFCNYTRKSKENL